jgi:prepilin-type N-terminal cleavage/methylation domain-containing protein
MKPTRSSRPRGFTLLETVIAIGVLAVLLTGFMVVFTPAAEGIRKSLNLQQADRMASSLEQELVTLRGTEAGNYKTGFNKAFDWIRRSNPTSKLSTDALLVYQYRGDVTNLRTADRTPTPVTALAGKSPGKDYVVVPMCRLRSDTLLASDLAAVEGAVYLVKPTQLVFTGGQLAAGTAGVIADPKAVPPVAVASADLYPEAVIAFSADFYIMPAKTAAYFTSTAFTSRFDTFKNPVFSRNLAVRR